MKALCGLVVGAVGACLHQQSTSPESAVVHAARNAPKAISPSEFRSFPLISSYDESHDTKVFRFALPESDQPLGTELASCVVFRYVDKDGKDVVRPYTPISKMSQPGYFEVMVKRYKNSQMGTHLHGLKKGDSIDVKGPFVKIPIKLNQYKQIGMLAGGTGITPMYQVAREVLAMSKNETEVSLVYASRRKEDVLLGNELNDLMERNPLFAPYYVLSKPPSTWMGGIGHINKEMIKSFMPPPQRAADTIIMVSGPPAFMETISGDKDFKSSPPAQGELKGLLREMGYHPRHIFKF